MAEETFCAGSQMNCRHVRSGKPKEGVSSFGGGHCFVEKWKTSTSQPLFPGNGRDGGKRRGEWERRGGKGMDPLEKEKHKLRGISLISQNIG